MKTQLREKKQRVQPPEEERDGSYLWSSSQERGKGLKGQESNPELEIMQ